MTPTIRDACERWPESEYDVVSFVDDLLLSGLRAGRVAGRLVSDREIEFTTTNEVVRVGVPSASLLRTVCARLAVLFGANEADPGLLYGGCVTKQLSVAGATFNAELELRNTLKDGSSFVVTRR